jgi:hypothetical protein
MTYVYRYTYYLDDSFAVYKYNDDDVCVYIISKACIYTYNVGDSYNEYMCAICSVS